MKQTFLPIIPSFVKCMRSHVYESDTYLLPFVLLLIILIIIFLKKNYICVATHVYISNDLWFPGNVHIFNIQYVVHN